MATYTVNFTIDDEAPGLSNSNQYPLLVLNSTYTPDNTLYFKQGDTIRVKHTHPEGLAITYTGPDGAPGGTGTQSAHPDPTPEGSQVSGYEWRQITWSGNLTDDSGNVTNSADDYETFWYFYASNSSGAFAYSQKLRLNKISISGSSLSAGTVAQGSNITFSVSDLVGLLPSSGSDGNRLFVYLQKDGSNFTTTGSAGVTWSAGSSYYGEITTASTSVTLTTGASMPVGTYTAYVGHYNANGGESAGTGAGNRLDSTPPSFSVVAPSTKLGIQVRNGSNNLILDDTYRLANLVVPQTEITLTTGSTQAASSDPNNNIFMNVNDAYFVESGDISFPGMTNTASNKQEFQVHLLDMHTGPTASSTIGSLRQVFILRGTNSFKIRLESYLPNSSATYKYLGYRF